MAWPGSDVSTVNIDQGTDKPDLWRPDGLDLVQKVNVIRNARGQADGIAQLDASGHVPEAELGKAIKKSGDTLTGFLSAHADPTSALHMATKSYVDNAILASSPFSTGTTMLFRNTVVSGWTLDTSFNNHAIRITTGTLNSSGTLNMDTVFGSGKNTGSTVLTVSQIPPHTHRVPNWTHGGVNLGYDDIAGVVQNGFVAAPTESTGGGGGHSHSLALDLRYVDFAVFVKD